MEWRVVRSHTIVEDVLKEFHSSRSRGHYVINRTLPRVRGGSTAQAETAYNLKILRKGERDIL